MFLSRNSCYSWRLYGAFVKGSRLPKVRTDLSKYNKLVFRYYTVLFFKDLKVFCQPFKVTKSFSMMKNFE